MSTTPKFPPGWKVFPVKAGAKEPAIFGWESEATDDVSQIEAWSIQFPGCNWGLACGPSNLAVIDVDGETGEQSLFDLELKHGPFPPTREHTTPRGGRHLIYSGTIRPTVSVIGKKLDTRGTGSLIIIPPSTFEGKPYAVSQDIPIVPVPAFAMAEAGPTSERVSAPASVALDTVHAKARARSLVERYVAERHVAIDGQGGDALTYAVAAEVISLGLSPEAALEVLLPWNDACLPPWNLDELGVKIENASRYAQNEAGAWYVPPVSERIPQDALDKLIAENAASSLPPEEDAEQGEHGRFDWMGEDRFKNLKPPQWLIKDKLVRESIGMIYGPSGHYKSFLAMDLAAQVAQTGELAFYVASEGVHRMARQDFPAWKLANGEERMIPFKLVEDMPIMAEDYDIEAFMKSIDAVARRETRHVGIVILDTLNNAMLGLEENSAMDAGKLIHAMKKIRKAFKTTVIVVHHTRQDGAEPRGSTALYAAFDTVLKVISKPETKLAQMFVTKQKIAEAPQHPFNFQGRRVGPGLAFQPVTDKEAAALRDEMDLFAPAKVSAALVQLKAWKPVTVSSQVLAGHLIPQLENENPEDRANSVARGVLGLRSALKRGNLGGYHEGEGRGIKWSLPAPEED